MNRKFKTITGVVLLMSVVLLMGDCKKCECGNDNGGGESNPANTFSGTNVVNSNCVQFTDKWKSSGNGFEHNMLVKLSCVSDVDTSRLEFDGICIKEFYGTNEVQVTNNVENGSHRILCYTVGTTDTVVNVSFEQNQNGVNNWTSNIHL